MSFYNTTHQHYCGIDLHARSLYVRILNQQVETLLHKEISAKPDLLMQLIEPYRDDRVIGIECMHCWYWIADLCEDQCIHSILGHASYMRATRDLLRRRTNLVRHGADLNAHVTNTTSQYNLPPDKVNLKNVSSCEQLKEPLMTRWSKAISIWTWLCRSATTVNSVKWNGCWKNKPSSINQPIITC